MTSNSLAPAFIRKDIDFDCSLPFHWGDPRRPIDWGLQNRLTSLCWSWIQIAQQASAIVLPIEQIFHSCKLNCTLCKLNNLFCLSVHFMLNYFHLCWSYDLFLFLNPLHKCHIVTPILPFWCQCISLAGSVIHSQKQLAHSAVDVTAQIVPCWLGGRLRCNFRTANM